jgi:hypothetical protein
MKSNFDFLNYSVVDWDLAGEELLIIPCSLIENNVMMWRYR